MKALVLILCLLTPALASAETVERARITHRGTEGWFFEYEIGNRMLKDLAELKVQRDLVLTLQINVTLLENDLELHKRWLKVEEGISTRYKKIAEDENKLRVIEQRRNDGFWNKKVTWFGLGFTVAGVFAILLNFGLSKAMQGAPTG